MLKTLKPFVRGVKVVFAGTSLQIHDDDHHDHDHDQRDAQQRDAQRADGPDVLDGPRQGEAIPPSPDAEQQQEGAPEDAIAIAADEGIDFEVKFSEAAAAYMVAEFARRHADAEQEDEGDRVDGDKKNDSRDCEDGDDDYGSDGYDEGEYEELELEGDFEY